MARPKTITEPMEHLPFLIETSLKKKFIGFCKRLKKSQVDYLRSLIQREVFLSKLSRKSGLPLADYIEDLLRRESIRLDKK